MLNDVATEYELREEVSRLKNHLSSTETELENTILENNELKRSVTKLISEIEMLKNLCKSPQKLINISAKKRHSLGPSVFCTPRNSQSSKETSLECANLQTKISILQKTLESAKTEIDNLNKQITNLQEKLQHRDFPNQYTNSFTTKDTIQGEKHHNIYILGDEQIRGLAYSLINSRTGAWNDKYKISATIITEGTSSVLLSYCEKLKEKLSPDDVVILSFGSHDSNLHKFHANLCIAINMLSIASVIVVPIYSNPHFNARKLYVCMEIWLKHFDNCTLINFYNINYNQYNSIQFYIKLITNKINYIIDYYEYKRKFLTFKNARNLTKNKCLPSLSQQQHEAVDLPKKGTIPYYFSTIYKNPSKNTCHSSNINNYGDNSSNNSTFFRAQDSE